MVELTSVVLVLTELIAGWVVSGDFGAETGLFRGRETVFGRDCRVGTGPDPFLGSFLTDCQTGVGRSVEMAFLQSFS